jgi:radical SAM superfamily enzyme with C-terminal helix-hairpin-helix motif
VEEQLEKLSGRENREWRPTHFKRQKNHPIDEQQLGMRIRPAGTSLRYIQREVYMQDSAGFWGHGCDGMNSLWKVADLT